MRESHITFRGADRFVYLVELRFPTWPIGETREFPFIGTKPPTAEQISETFQGWEIVNIPSRCSDFYTY